jgi:hypothetical protein
MGAATDGAEVAAMNARMKEVLNCMMMMSEGKKKEQV